MAITELGGFTHAARRLHRSQPAISRRLGILEHELGAPLFERLRGHARLTEAGRVFLPHAEAALASLRDGRDAVRGLQTGMEGVISLALVGTLADTRIVDALRQFAKRAQGMCGSNSRTASSREVTDLVRRGDATLGLRYYASRPAGARLIGCRGAKPWWWSRHGASPGRPSGQPGAATRWRAMGRFSTGVGEQDSGHTLARQLVRAGLDGADVTLIDSLTAQKRLAQAGFGLALVPESSVRDELRQGALVALDIPAMQTAISITAIHRRNGYLSPAAKRLLALLTSGTLQPKVRRPVRAQSRIAD